MAVLFLVLLLHAFILIIKAEITADGGAVILTLICLVLIEAEGTALCSVIVYHIIVNAILTGGSNGLWHGFLLIRYAVR